MTPLELFAILVLAGAIIVLIYYYLKEIDSVSSEGFRSGIAQMSNRVSEGISEAGERFQTSGEENGEVKRSGVSERVSEMGEKLRGRVRDVPISTDVLSGRIDEFLNDQSDQLIKDWSLATKTDLNDLEKRYTKVSRDVDDLSKRFDEFRNHANKKFEHIEQRLEELEKIESPEE